MEPRGDPMLRWLPVVALFLTARISTVAGEPATGGAPLSQQLGDPVATRKVLLEVFHPEAVYENGVLARRELIAVFPSTWGLAPDHPLVPLFLYQKALADAHERLRKEDTAYRDQFDRTFASIDLPLDVSEYEGREILYRGFLGKGIYERLLAEVGPTPPLPPEARANTGRQNKPFYKRVETDVPKVIFPPSLRIFRYCSDGVKYDALAGDPFRDAHERLVAKDATYRDAIKRAIAGLGGVTASDARLTLQFRQALLEAGIDKVIEAEASKGGTP